MVGNVIEWVQDWGPLATAASNWGKWSHNFGKDMSHMGGGPPPSPPATPLASFEQYGLPGGTTRGGSFGKTPSSGGFLEGAGVYEIDQSGLPASYGDMSATGFRCGR